MKKQVLLLYNPKSGNRQIISELDNIIEKVQRLGYEITIHRSSEKGDITQYIIEKVKVSQVDLILVSGGDGTINECVTGIMQKGLDIPLGILPLGTANDLAVGLEITGNIEELLEHIEYGIPKRIDVGKINEQYFINIAAIGLFSGVSHTIDKELKKKFGKFAYYMEALKQVSNFKSLEVRLEYDSNEIISKYTLILILNGTGAGGFKRLAKKASLEDGMLDIICIKEVPVYKVPELFLNIINGKYENNEYVDYIQTDRIGITSIQPCEQKIDIDGEIGPKLPIDIEIISKAITVLVKEYKID